MRERLTLTLVGLILVVVTIMGGARILAAGGLVREGLQDTLASETVRAARVIEARHLAGEEVTRQQVVLLATPEMQLIVEHPDHADVVARGSRFDPSDTEGSLTSTQTVGDTTVRAMETDERARLLTAKTVGFQLALMLGMLVLAAIVAFFVADRLTRPLIRLAQGATALARGRFDLELPESRVPEIEAVRTSLQAGAERVRLVMERDHQVLQRISHALRTPLTSLRLELEEVLLDEQLDDDARASLERGLGDVRRLQDTVGDVLEWQRGKSVMFGSEVSLAELARQAERHWRGRLPATRAVWTFVDCGGDLKVTPGPVEQVLDNILADVDECGTGAVTLRLEAEDTHVRMQGRGRPGAYGRGRAAGCPAGPGDGGAARRALVRRCARRRPGGPAPASLTLGQAWKRWDTVPRHA